MLFLRGQLNAVPQAQPSHIKHSMKKEASWCVGLSPPRIPLSHSCSRQKLPGMVMMLQARFRSAGAFPGWENSLPFRIRSDKVEHKEVLIDAKFYAVRLHSHVPISSCRRSEFLTVNHVGLG